ncbi:MAG: PaaX family transcriptional regulator [Nocardioides sp.]
MHARSALFDVYGDHLRGRGSQAPVAGLVRLLDPVGIAAPAVRTAISRMVSEGWLEPVRLQSGRGYRATSRTIRWLEDISARVYRSDTRDWDGYWHLALIDHPAGRPDRTRLRADLSFVGYAELTPHTWVSPFPRAELDEVLARAGATARLVRADLVEPSPIEAWDLPGLGAAYEQFVAEADTLLEGVDAHGPADADEAAFAARFRLVHEWRKFLFTDPGLPDELLPADWPGRAAAELFNGEARRLKPAADRFLASCLD